MQKIVKSVSKMEQSKSVNTTKDVQKNYRKNANGVRDVVNLLSKSIPGIKFHMVDEQGNLVEIKSDEELN